MPIVQKSTLPRRCSEEPCSSTMVPEKRSIAFNWGNAWHDLALAGSRESAVEPYRITA